MSRYIKIIWINIMEEWDFLNQLMVSELQRPFFLDFNKNGLPLPLPLSFPLPSQTLQFWEIVS